MNLIFCLFASSTAHLYTIARDTHRQSERIIKLARNRNGEGHINFGGQQSHRPKVRRQRNRNQVRRRRKP